MDRASLCVSPQKTISFSSFSVVLPALAVSPPAERLFKAYKVIFFFFILEFCVKHPGLVESIYRKISQQPSM